MFAIIICTSFPQIQSLNSGMKSHENRVAVPGNIILGGPAFLFRFPLTLFNAGQAPEDPQMPKTVIRFCPNLFSATGNVLFLPTPGLHIL